MKFVRVHQLADGLAPLRDRLLKELTDGKQVFWLVPGGSNIPLTVAVMAQLPDELTSKLTILLTDERYGKVGHPDSNARQLDETGFLPKQAMVIPVLRGGLSIEETATQYGKEFSQAAKAADVIIGQFGMGADGHIAGILPGSDAVRSADMTVGYTTPTFRRITLTPAALRQLTAAYVFAFGDEKRPALARLQSESLDLDEQPVQIIKHIPDAYVYNDQIDSSNPTQNGATS